MPPPAAKKTKRCNKEVWGMQAFVRYTETKKSKIWTETWGSDLSANPLFFLLLFFIEVDRHHLCGNSHQVHTYY